MDNLLKYILIGFVSFVVGWLLKYFESKAKLVYWQPHYALFEIPEPKVSLQTDSISIQNLGRVSSENIEIIFKEKLDYFKITPSISYETEELDNSNYIIKLKSLGPNEFFTLHILSYETLPILENICSKEGLAEQILFQMQQQYPSWYYYVYNFFFLIGIATILYLFVKWVIILL